MKNLISEDFWIKDLSLWKQGQGKIAATLSDMPGLQAIMKIYETEEPLKDVRITGCVTVTYETANFVLLLTKLGAKVRWCSDNRFATKDDATAFLAFSGIPVFAKSHETEEEYEWCMEQALAFSDDEGGNVLSPDMIVDDGADLTQYIYKYKKFDQLINLKSISEQTTCGINYLYNQYKMENLFKGVININDSIVKSNFDNHYGIKESLITGIYNSSYTQICGKKIVIAGYGKVGQGAASALRGIGANVSITEIDPIKFAKAHLDGFDVTTIDEGSRTGDIFITATGCIDVIRREHILKMKSGTILINIGHGNEEIEVSYLENDPIITKKKNNEFCDTYEFPDGKKILVLCGGYLVNLRAAKGNPPRVMSLTFTNHILALLDVWKNPDKYSQNIIYQLSKETNDYCAQLNFPDIMSKLTQLTQKQIMYLGANLNRNPEYIELCSNYSKEFVNY